MNDVPQRVDVRNLVCEVLNQIHHHRNADDDVAVEGLELRRQADPAVAGCQSQNRDRRVQIDAGRKREPERAAQGGQVHKEPSRSNFATSPRTRAISSSRSSSVMHVVGTGFPILTLTLTGLTMGLPLRIAARPPLMATGTTGVCAPMAMMNPPFLNGRRSPVRLRVPSGKIRNEFPALSDSAPMAIDRIELSRSLRSMGTNPPTSNTVP